jgi:fructose-1,6-bisphosphatase I
LRGLTLKEILANEDRDLQRLIFLLADLGLRIAREIPRRLEATNNVNTYGDKQLALDVWSNELLVHKLLGSGLVKQLASEELEEPLSSKRGDYTIVIDPLDGSSNITTNNLMGTIIGIYHDKTLPAAGKDLLASMYFLYGPYLGLVLGRQKGVNVFVAAGRRAEGYEKFITSGEPHHFPKEPNVYGIGGLRDKWTPRVRSFAELIEKRRLTLRYGGSLVGDFTQVLTKGGFFAYPELVDAPLGKYRLNFEANPIAFITEKAGGKASTGSGRILDVEPTDLAQRVPTYLGNSDLVTEFDHSLAN